MHSRSILQLSQVCGGQCWMLSNAHQVFDWPSQTCYKQFLRKKHQTVQSTASLMALLCCQHSTYNKHKLLCLLLTGKLCILGLAFSILVNPLKGRCINWLHFAIQGWPTFLISDIRALWRSTLNARVPEYQKLKMFIRPGWHWILLNDNDKWRVVTHYVTHYDVHRVK